MALRVTPLLKQDDELTVEDLEQHPVWMSVHGEDEDEKWYSRCDETTVRPWVGLLPVDPDKEERTLILAATFAAPIGSQFSGAILAIAAAGIANKTSAQLASEIQPRIFVDGSPYYFWGGRVGTTISSQARFASLVDASRRDVFPLRFFVRRGLTNGLDSGLIENFYRISADDQPGIDDGTYAPPTRPPGIGDLVEGGRWDEALALATVAIEMNPNDPEVRRRRSYVYSAKGDLNAALIDAVEALELCPIRQDLYSLVCSYLLALHRYEDCLRYCKTGLAAQLRDPRTTAMMESQLMFLKARALYGLGRPAEALVDLENLFPSFSMGCPGVTLMTHRSLLKACRSALRR